MRVRVEPLVVIVLIQVLVVVILSQQHYLGNHLDCYSSFVLPLVIVNFLMHCLLFLV